MKGNGERQELAELMEWSAQLVTKVVIPAGGIEAAKRLQRALSNSVIKLARQLDLARDAGENPEELLKMFRETNAMRRGVGMGILRTLGR